MGRDNGYDLPRGPGIRRTKMDKVNGFHKKEEDRTD